MRWMCLSLQADPRKHLPILKALQTSPPPVVRSPPAIGRLAAAERSWPMSRPIGMSCGREYFGPSFGSAALSCAGFLHNIAAKSCPFGFPTAPTFSELKSFFCLTILSGLPKHSAPLSFKAFSASRAVRNSTTANMPASQSFAVSTGSPGDVFTFMAWATLFKNNTSCEHVMALGKLPTYSSRVSEVSTIATAATPPLPVGPIPSGLRLRL
mmetsp:Transcript_16031/g.43977  ORF Transcript_16031/g.43977 Transcript_16031/m.43977 type:complete len:211 (-) Transcript_16031:1262-1894(-)